MVDSAEIKRVFKYAEFLAAQKLQRVLDQGDIADQLADSYFDSNYRPMMHVVYIPGLIEETEHDAQAWDILNRIVARFIVESEPLPDDLRRWLVGLLKGKFPRPVTSGRPSQITRDSAVILAIECVREGCPDLTVTRNETFGEQPNAAGRSVCDAVGLALQRKSIKITPLNYSNIRGIWQRHVKESERIAMLEKYVNYLT